MLLSGMMAMVNMVQPIDTIATVYNFEVEKTHNYYVGTEGVLVHNECNLYGLKNLLDNNVLWNDFAANLKTLNTSLTKAERQVFYGKLNEVFKGEKLGLEKFIKDFNGDEAFRTIVTKNPERIGVWVSKGKIAVIVASRNSERILNVLTDSKIIDRVKELRQKLTSDYKKSGNFGWAETPNLQLTKKEYYAHSSIDELTGTLPERVPDISLKPVNEIFPWSSVPNAAGYPIARNIDSEYKILTEIAEKLGNNTNVTGKIKLFTERPPCSSCSNVINEFLYKYKNIEIEVVHNNGVLLTNFF